MASSREYEMLFKLNAQLGSSYTGTFKSAQAEIAAFQKGLDALNKAQADITAYQKQQVAVEATEKKLALLRQQYDNIQREMTETGVSSSDLQNKLLAKQHQIDTTTLSIEKQTGKLAQMKTELQEAGISTADLTKESAKLADEMKQVKAAQESAADKANSFGALSAQAIAEVHEAIVAAGVAKALKEIYDWFKETADAAVEFESAITGVDKTTDLTAEELAAMSSALKEMATNIPATTTELAAVGEMAGQLGIAKENILSFTEVMTMLGTATNLSAEAAATQLAKFANITKMSAQDYGKLGSVIVELGNNFATTEADIVNMGQNLAAAGSMVGVSEANIMGLAATLSSLGIEAQMGGTAISKLMREFETMIATGSEDLDEFAKVAGMSADEFKAAWGQNAVGAIASFIEGLGAVQESGGSTIATLDQLGITESRQVDAISRLSSSGGLLVKSINMSNAAWAENTALTAEADKRYATTQSKLVMMQNAYNNLKIAVGDNYTPALQKLYTVATQVLKSVTEFVEQNPGLVRAGTTFVAILGTVVIALTAYTVAVNLAKTATSLLTATIPGVNVIMGVSLAVAALAAGVAALSDSSGEAVPTVSELTEAARAMNRTMDEATAAYNDTIASTQAAANVADTYIGRLEAMEAAGLKTNEQKREYHNILALLCETVPELAGLIDLETDSINGGTTALRENTEAWQKAAMQKAYQEQLTALYKSYSATLIEAEKNSIGLTKAKDNLTVAEKKQQDAMARMDKLSSEAAEKAAAMTKETGFAADTTAYLTQEYHDLLDALPVLGDEVYNASQTVNSYEKAIAKGADSTADAKEQIALAEEAVKNLTYATDAEAQAAQNTADQQKALQAAINDVKQEADALAEAYGKAYDAALSSVSGQYDLWDKADKVVATSAWNINSALESQVTYWQNYNSNLEKLTARGTEIDGLSDMLASFADGSKDSAAAIAGMAGASDKDLTTMVANWKKLQDEQENTAGSLAELETNFSKSMEALQKEVSDTVIAMDLNNQAATSGKNTAQGFIDGALDMLPEVQEAYGKLAQTAKDALSFKIQYNSHLYTQNETVDGSHANGLDYVPYDGYIAELHKGERVLTAEEAQLVAFTPQLITALGSYRAANAMSAPPIEAMSFGSGGSSLPPIHIHFDISGNVDEGTVDSLRQYGDDFAARVIEVMEEFGIDRARRDY